MSFPKRRYEYQGARAPIFGISRTLMIEPNAFVPIIPNITGHCGGFGLIFGIAPFIK
jgi:hypothetical protein